MLNKSDLEDLNTLKRLVIRLAPNLDAIVALRDWINKDLLNE